MFEPGIPVQPSINGYFPVALSSRLKMFYLKKMETLPLTAMWPPNSRKLHGTMAVLRFNVCSTIRCFEIPYLSNVVVVFAIWQQDNNLQELGKVPLTNTSFWKLITSEPTIREVKLYPAALCNTANMAVSGLPIS